MTPYHFLIIRWSGMGDVVMTLPALKWLQGRFRGCRIWYLTDTVFAKIPELSGFVEGVEAVDRRGFRSPRRLPTALWKALRTVNRLRRASFHRIFDLQGFGETAILAYLIGAPVRVGRVKSSSLRRRLYTLPIHADWEHDHRSRYFVQAVAESFGEDAPQKIESPHLPIRFRKPCVRPTRIGLNIGASTESRRWSEHHFFHLAERLSDKGLRIRFFLGPQERFLKGTVQKQCRQHGWEYIETDDIVALIEGVSDCRMLVSNDTGPGHLAAAVGIPVLTLFSTGSPENVGPLAEHRAWFRNPADINAISVCEVESACERLISSIRD